MTTTIPSLMRLAFEVSVHAVLALEPLGALSTIKLSEARKILSGLGLLPLCQVFRGLQVLLDLINISKKAAG
jgi:hypothetical protein